MEVGQGDDFDAELHEAITQIPAPEDKLKGKIVDVVGTGYTLGENYTLPQGSCRKLISIAIKWNKTITKY